MNLGDIREDAFYRLSIADGETIDDTYANRRINEEYKRLVSELGTNIKATDLVFVADDPEVDLPTDVLRVLTIYRAGYPNPLERISPERLSEQEAARSVTVSSTAGGPIQYTENGVKKIYVEPPPETSTATGAKIRYVAVPTVLALDADIPVDLPEAYHDVLVERVVNVLALSEEETALANLASQRERELHMATERDSARRPGGDRFTRTRGLPPARTER